MYWKRVLSITALGLALLLQMRGVQADRAIVVGVNHYPNLPSDNQLEGCENDANSMAGALQKYGFKVERLLSDKATHEGILNALKQMETSIGADERFVFFFAGHGSRTTDGKGSILPSDALDDEKMDIMADQLYGAVKRVPAHSRTVLLDSCFSGAVARDVRPGHRKVRCYVRKQGKGVREGQDTPQPVNQQDDPSQFLEGGPEVCYCVAARKNEMAHEDDFNGTRQGYFTHYAVQRLTGARDRWGDVQKDVSGGVSAIPDLFQHPCLSASYADVAVFDPKNGMRPEPVKNRTVWDNFVEDRADATALAMEMNPNSSVLIKDEDHFTMLLKPGREGYLVLMARAETGELQLLFPKTRASADAKVSAGQSLKLPTANTKLYTVDAEGAQEFKAILFNSAAEAQALLDAFPASLSIDSAKAAKQRGVRESGGESIYVTAAFSFQVVGKGEKGKKK